MDCRFPHRLRLLIISLSYFAISYLSTGFLAASSPSVSSYRNGLDAYQIFIDWMIIPYSTSILFYCYSILATKNRLDLRILLAKLSWATFIASAFFLIFPAQFSQPLPLIENKVFAVFYSLLHTVDNPYNQAPSLHVIFCVIFYREIPKLIKKPIILFASRCWLMLIILSTWFTFQHHSIDILSGLIIGVCINYFINKPQHYIGSIYLMMSGLMILVANFITANSVEKIPLLIITISYYLALSFALVSIVYLKNKPELLGKSQSRFNMLTWLLYGPYLLIYRLLWLLNNYHLQRHSPHSEIITQVTERLWVGPRLSEYDLSRLFNQQKETLLTDIRFIDLSAEVAEVDGINESHYQLFSMLDLQAPCFNKLRLAVQTVQAALENNETVYLHCAMGYSRSFLVACIYLIAYKNQSVNNAKNYLLSLNDAIKLPPSYISDDDLIAISKDCTIKNFRKAPNE